MEDKKDFIQFNNVSYSYDETPGLDNGETKLTSVAGKERHFAVEDLNFTVDKGEFIAIVGRNGSGKSTAARLINALLQPVSGTVVVNGIKTSQTELIWDIRTNVGMVFQNPDNQIIGMSVEEDVAFGPENLGISREEMLKRIDDSLEITGLSGLRKSEPHLLSGGQKQRVAIAGVLAMRPECIVLDEATAMLDPVGRREVMTVIKQLNRENGITIALITHHMDELAEADRVILIDNGKIKMTGTPKEIFSRANEVKAAGLDIPQVTQLFKLLNDRGCALPNDAITVDEAEKILLEKLKPFMKEGS